MSDKIISLKEWINTQEEVNYPNEVVTISFDSEGSSAHFTDKTFTCRKLIFEHINSPEYNFKFSDCTFNCEVEFINCTLEEISFKNTESIKSLVIKGKDENNKSVLKSLKFYYSNEYSEFKPKPQLSTYFYISHVTILDSLLIQNIEHVAGKFEFIGNELGGKEVNAITFNGSNFCNTRFLHNEFKDKTTFKNTSFKYDLGFLESSRAGYEHTRFYDNTFSKVDFSESKFDNLIEFDYCTFQGTSLFEECNEFKNSYIKFIACKFEKYTLFDNSKFNKIEILHSKFLEKVSFENFETNYFQIHQVTFAEMTYFNGLNENNNDVIENWDRKTLIAIKRELQKTEDRIDFNRFRGYELAAHYKELDWKWKSGFKDKFILCATKWSTDFGNSWRRAIPFTLLLGLLFYIIFFIFEYYLSGNYQYYFNTNYSGIFWNGYMRFLLVTDFYNPLIEDRIYIQNFWSWIPFIIGKIVIAFGIYEMIQSFRKFKA